MSYGLFNVQGICSCKLRILTCVNLKLVSTPLAAFSLILIANLNIYICTYIYTYVHTYVPLGNCVKHVTFSTILYITYFVYIQFIEIQHTKHMLL